jgi:hypothetical protein
VLERAKGPPSSPSVDHAITWNHLKDCQRQFPSMPMACIFGKFILNFDVFQEDVLIQRLHPQLCVPVGAPLELVLGALLNVRVTRRRLLYVFRRSPMSLCPFINTSASLRRSFGGRRYGLLRWNETATYVYISCHSFSCQPDRLGEPIFVLSCTTTKRLERCAQAFFGRRSGHLHFFFVRLSLSTNVPGSRTLLSSELGTGRAELDSSSSDL